MRYTRIAAIAALISLAISTQASLAGGSYNDNRSGDHDRGDQSIQLGPRPFYLVQGMDPSPLKSRLLHCQNGPFRRTDFSIASWRTATCTIVTTK